MGIVFMSIFRNARAIFFLQLICFCIFTNFSYAEKIDSMQDFHYDVEWSINEKKGLLKNVSTMVVGSEIDSVINGLRLITHKDKIVSNMHILKDRVANDKITLCKYLHSLGYYNAKINFEFKQVNQKFVKVILHVDPEKIFRLKLDVSYVNQDQAFNEKRGKKLHKQLRNFKASIDEITQLIKFAVDDLRRNGFPKPEILKKEVTIKYSENEAHLDLVIDTGPKAVFGETEINAVEGIDEKFIRNRIDWEEGEPFNADRIISTEENLRSTQIFSKIKIKEENEDMEDGELPILLKLGEDKKHMLDIGLMYSTARKINAQKKSRSREDLESIIAKLSWTRFNAFGGGEKLQISMQGTPAKSGQKRADYVFKIILAQPDVFIKNNTLEYKISRQQELTNAFFQKSDKLDLHFSYPIRGDLFIQYGGIFEENYVDVDFDFFKKNGKYKLLTFPVELILNRTDSLLNPSKGYKAGLKFYESFASKSQFKNFGGIEANFSYNFPLDSLKRNILAFHITKKMIFQADLKNIPADKLLYCGGMHSVRGYSNQMAGEVLRGTECPAGGKSSWEFNSEFRRKFSQDFGGVLFFDGAKVFHNQASEISLENKRWFFAYGLGVRYFTSIGPIRFDFAFPIKRRRGIDSKMHFIMSLGQAF